jgi:hypothetical protein
MILLACAERNLQAAIRAKYGSIPEDQKGMLLLDAASGAKPTHPGPASCR